MRARRRGGAREGRGPGVRNHRQRRHSPGLRSCSNGCRFEEDGSRSGPYAAHRRESSSGRAGGDEREAERFPISRAGPSAGPECGLRDPAGSRVSLPRPVRIGTDSVQPPTNSGRAKNRSWPPVHSIERFLAGVAYTRAKPAWILTASEGSVPTQSAADTR